MRTFNWAEDFREKTIIEDIPTSVQKLERNYWISTTFFGITLVFGMAILFIAPITDIKLLGLFVALLSIIALVADKLYVNIRLSMYHIIWDNKNRIEMEIRKSEAQDL